MVDKKPEDKGTLAEKVENVKVYFRSREEFERRKGGRTHYRVILSFDVPATNQQITELANDFLGQVFPRAIGFGAIHRDTEHPHAHIYLHSRQTDGKRIQLKNNDFRSIDERWAKVWIYPTVKVVVEITNVFDDHFPGRRRSLSTQVQYVTMRTLCHLQEQ